MGDGFIITAQEAQKLFRQTDVNYRDVVRPYLIGDDVAEDPMQEPRRWIIDFAQKPLEAATRYPDALKIVRQRVKPGRETNRRKARRERWWLFGEQAAGMRAALSKNSRFIAGAAQGKRLLFAWANAWTCPSNATNVFAFDDDYAMGVLSSSSHNAWAKSRSSTLEDRLRYTPSSVFETFPWPDPLTDQQRERIAEASRIIIARRQEICNAGNFGLTALYNAIDEGAYTDLRAMHRELDEAVAAAYGWPKLVAHNADEIVRRLLVLNGEIAAATREYNPFDLTPELILIPGQRDREQQQRTDATTTRRTR